MDELRADLEFAGVAVRVQGSAPAAALRYFASDGEFAACADAAGAALPGTLAARDTGRELVLAWRSPTETLCLARSAQRLAQLCAQLEGVPGGCCVELTGALTVLHLNGERIADLLARIGSAAAVPRAGEARRSRMADVPVLALCVNAPEVLLVVERGYAPHLLGWIRETLLDFL
jgi:heterotetrameric sarcosine oxidase gamma subunit